MGEVFLALDPNIDRQLAIKTVRLVGPPEEIEERKRRLLREAKAAGRLLHPNVVALFDAGEAEGLLYLAFEFVDGPDLSRRMYSPPPLSLGQILRLGREVASALEAAHRQGIVHRDIKPSNVILSPDGLAKVADFGIAKLAGMATQLTQSGSVVGSPQYMSPEQIRGEELDGRSDIFSLGVLLYELLSRRRPFAGETISTLVFQILSQEPLAIDQLQPLLPPRLARLVHAMLAKDREQRLGSAAEVVAELSTIERELLPEQLAASSVDEQAATRLLGSSAPKPPPLPTAPPATPGRAATTPPPIPPPPPPIQATAVSPGAGSGGMVSGGTYAMPKAPTRRTWIALAAAAVVLFAGGFALLQLLSGQPATESPASRVSPPPPATTPSAERPQSNLTPSPGRSESTRPGPAEATPPLTGPRTADPARAAPPPPTSEGRSPRHEPASTLPSPPPSNPRTETVASRPLPPPSVRPVVPPPTSEPAAGEASPTRDDHTDDRADDSADDSATRKFDQAAARAERTLETGLRFQFQVEPDDAFIKVWERSAPRAIVQGRASAFAVAKKNTQVLELPGDGDYLIIVDRDGFPEEAILVHAQAARGQAPHLIRANLNQRASGGLKVVVVSQAIAFEGTPDATVLIDGVPRGKASEWPGGRQGSEKNLKLPPGNYLVRLEAPGRKPYEVRVEVRPDAREKRAVIRYALF